MPTLIVERNARPGDSWRKRYKSLCLHDPVWYDHLPYIDFPKNWPVFSPKDKIGDWLEMYAKVMELNYWGSTEAKSATYDEKAKEWTVVVEREGKEIVLKPKQLVLATGMSGKPNLPRFKGMERFKGDQHHSSQHPGPDAYAGKRAVVIGSNNSAHDIAAAFWEAGADVTMVQRSSTHIVRSDSLMDIGLGALYSEQAVAAGVTTAKADLIFASIPYAILHEFQIPLYEQMKQRDAKFYERPREGGLHARLGRRQFRPVHEVPSARLGLLHRYRRLAADHRRGDQAGQRRQRKGGDRAFGDPRQRRRTAGRPRSSMPRAMAR